MVPTNRAGLERVFKNSTEATTEICGIREIDPVLALFYSSIAVPARTVVG